MEEVICIIRENEELKNFVKWFMVESYLYDGRQDFPCHSSEPIPFRVLHGDIKKWLSLTDPCIWREKTEELIMNLYNLI
jgi:3-deoxy-D-arabino-heptulosonate 7-phosphate (DAHP) synthase